VHLYGTHTVDIQGELAGLDDNGYRPLREPAAMDGAVQIKLLPGWPAAPSGGVGGGAAAGDGFGAGPRVAFQGPDGSVPRAGEQRGGIGAGLGFVGEHGMPQLVQRPAV
jgi:hypothetical protein